MSVKATTATLLLAAIFGMASSVAAKDVSIKGNGPSQVKASCSGDGDVYWIPGKSGHTYGCMHADGSGIVCSGVTPKQKKTCSTFRTGSFPVPKLPTREDAGKVDATENK